MKNNTSQVKGLLEQALRALPEDFALEGARSHIVSAINQVGAVEYRRARAENTRINAEAIQKKEAEAKKLGIPVWQMSLPMTKSVIAGLDKMIQSEVSKLENIREANNAKKNPRNNNDDGVSTIYN